MNRKEIQVDRLSDFWSNTEYKAIKGNPPHRMAVYRAKLKLKRAISGIKEIESPRIFTLDVLIELLKATENALKVTGLDDEASTIEEIRKSIEAMMKTD